MSVLRVGADVSWDDGSGVVDMVVTAGEVPGVEQPAVGTKSAPVARVRVGGGRRVAVPVAQLDVAAPVRLPPAAAVRAVRERGLGAWPGQDATSLSRQQWADARTKAFTATWNGNRPGGYFRDDDLLPGA